MPVFWWGLILILFFSVTLRWLPSGGMGGWKTFILPAVVLGTASAGIIARMTRSSMMDVLRQDYITTARSKGLRHRIIIRRHALRNALIPTVTVVGLQFGYMLAGAVLTESVFAWPGVGRLLVTSILSRDYPVVQTTLIMVALTFVLVNLGVDILYAYLDPRIRYHD
jgi:ABC-type dipeptide/oligopeptide/nickel transport system permease component